MSMKIDHTDPSLLRTAGKTRQDGPAESAPASRPTAEPGSTDTVNLTDAAHDAAEAARALAAEPAFDAERVESIRAAIARGDYPVDAARLADAIIDLENELPESSDDS